MREQPMTKMFKGLVTAMIAAILAAVLVDAPADAAHDPIVNWWAASEVPGAGAGFSSDGGATWTATYADYRAGEDNAAQDNGDGPYNGTFRCCAFYTQYSSDGGSTWTATHANYRAGEHTGDNGDGPDRGTFRARLDLSIYSSDGGSTWGTATYADYRAGEDDAAQDNGDGPTAGTFRHRYTALEFSFDSGATWTNEGVYFGRIAGAPDRPEHPTWRYWAGEDDPAQDNGDGPTAGTFRHRDTSAKFFYYSCTRGQLNVRNPPNSGLIRTTSQLNPPCVPTGGSVPTGRGTYTWNVDDGIEPTGDWCVTGRALADGRSIICRGEGYTYREARRELGFGLGRP